MALLEGNVHVCRLKKGFLANELRPVQTQSQRASRVPEFSVEFEKTHTGLNYIKSHLKDQPTVHSGDTPQSSDEEDFFSTIKKGKAHENTKQLESYLANPDDDMDVLKSYPAVCHLSLKLNTPLPASAACERLFSTAGLILRPRRARIGSKNFENQLLLKLNKPFW